MDDKVDEKKSPKKCVNLKVPTKIEKQTTVKSVSDFSKNTANTAQGLKGASEIDTFTETGSSEDDIMVSIFIIV